MYTCMYVKGSIFKLFWPPISIRVEYWNIYWNIGIDIEEKQTQIFLHISSEMDARLGNLDEIYWM